MIDSNKETRELQRFTLGFENAYGSVETIQGNAKEIMRFLLEQDLVIKNKR